MKNLLAILLTSLASIGTTNATLIDRGGGLIYDDDLNITWLADVDYAKTSGYNADGLMTWDEAVAWTAQLSYSGYDNWRLPSSDLCWGYNCTGSEMGHLFYIELDGVAGKRITDIHDDANFNLFSNFQPIVIGPSTVGHFWLGNNFGNGNAGFFSYDGRQGGDDVSSRHYVLPVLDGDMAATSVPEPASVSLILAGLAALGIAMRKRRAS